jgi:DNA-binding beta-propeller fold protein YncE
MNMKFLSLALLLQVPLVAQSVGHTHFEGRQTHSVDVTPDGRLLLSVNTPDGRLCVHSLEVPASPILIAEISTGLEPVAVRARGNHEAWVVNEASDTVTVVSLASGKPVASMSVSDDPADVAFANGKAFVTCSGSRLIRVFDVDSLQPLGTIPVQGISPGALAVSPDGSRVFAAFLYSGNGTTVLPAGAAPAPPAPTNPLLPAAPQTALIVPASHPGIDYTVLDHDVVEIDTESLAVVRYLGGTGTHPFDLTINPVAGGLWIANSESHNLTRFEPALKARFSSHRLTKVSLSGDAPLVIHDLNPGIDYNLLPNPAALATSLAQPTGIRISVDGAHAWVAAFNSDRIAKIETATGQVVARIDLRTGVDTSSSKMRGPRSLVLHPSQPHLYVLNKLSNTISTIRTTSLGIDSEVPVGSNDPLPASIKEGRGFFYDARLSGNGTVSCATCHLDADRDGIAWDLGDPGGNMTLVKGSALSGHITRVKDRNLHPMKGPMVTQTLRGLAFNDADPALLVINPDPRVIATKFHWRGDKPSIQSFNSTFSNLLGGVQIPVADMDDLAAYLLSIRHAPNPNLNPDGTLPTSLNGGNAVNGSLLFQNHLSSHCATCHAIPAGTDQNIDLRTEVGGNQDVKNPSLRTTYQRAGLFNNASGGTSLSGFGLGSDGTRAAFPISHPYVLSELSTAAEFADVAAFITAFDTGTAPAATATILLDTGNSLNPDRLAAITILEHTAASTADLTATIHSGGISRSYLYDKASGLYLADKSGASPLTRLQLIASIMAGDSILFSGTPPGQGVRTSIDRDGDGLLNGDEPLPVLQIEPVGPAAIRLKWPVASIDWRLETSGSLVPGSWIIQPSVPQAAGGFLELQQNIVPPHAFYRLHRTW